MFVVHPFPSSFPKPKKMFFHELQACAMWDVTNYGRRCPLWRRCLGGTSSGIFSLYLQPNGIYLGNITWGWGNIWYHILF